MLIYVKIIKYKKIKIFFHRTDGRTDTYSSEPHKNKKIFFILNYLFRNLQEIRKILKLKLKTQILRQLKTQTQTQT
jgi:hypothetical protein